MWWTLWTGLGARYRAHHGGDRGAESGVSLRTLSRWAAQYCADTGSRGLELTRRADLGRRRIPAELVEVIEALALGSPEPTAAFIHRRVSDIAADRGLTVPSYSSVRAVIAVIDPDLSTLAQHGDAAYRDQFELVLRRTAACPNEQWQPDHTLLDVAILDNTGAPHGPG